MEEIKEKIKKLIDEDRNRFTKNYITYKLEVDELTDYNQIIVWIHNNKNFFNKYYKQDLELLLQSISLKNLI
jgi:hypothetical protein